MIVYTDYLWFNTRTRQEFIRITDEIAAIVQKSGVNEATEKLAPAGLDYRHHQTGEDNADAHLKRTILGHQVTLPITKGARSRAVGAGVLRRARRSAQETRRRQSDGHLMADGDRPIA
jgi:thiamine phosphate synthase YjbQ (UPF0047 family)